MRFSATRYDTEVAARRPPAVSPPSRGQRWQHGSPSSAAQPVLALDGAAQPMICELAELQRQIGVIQAKLTLLENPLQGPLSEQQIAENNALLKQLCDLCARRISLHRLFNDQLSWDSLITLEPSAVDSLITQQLEFWQQQRQRSLGVAADDAMMSETKTAQRILATAAHAAESTSPREQAAREGTSLASDGAAQPSSLPGGAAQPTLLSDGAA